MCLVIESITIRQRIRSHPIARGGLAVAEIVEGRRPADRLMGARGAVLPIPERRPGNGVR
jgi:hypothetical protein